MDRSPQPNTLGNASLALGIASAAFVFGIGLCALAGRQQPWLQAAGLSSSAGPAALFWVSWPPGLGWVASSAATGRERRLSPACCWEWWACASFLPS
ncbi:MAG: hypothetical protein L0322_04935 [Chloroflexi bacterium]|nr:hypothetical protein [Chloroflexota bacterium]MCI0577207.1 hypothetical protein [Chloroflexota bacterium]MCI0649083.1 hypothetical protein [Chloroflexota bacterium]